ncbi:DUF6491 family protein [Sphingobium boeckii]|uniref:Lipoprotein n=1 Tax=Sphingobium boeckii TaxID=1082345 RepID=A0A7W9AEZ7_9SPHN|nr:DUF6491 family protein [Sphingobium boeckii]MBB5684358.1 hypothetical protein [Sphingobium boeckii]
MRMFLPIMASLLVSACADVPPSPAAQARIDREEAKLAKALAGKVPGKPVSCITLRNVDSMQVYGERTLIYRINSKLSYRNDPYGGCPGLTNSRTLITRTPTGQLCRGDIARVADLVAGFETGSCALGDFVPYRPG